MTRLVLYDYWRSSASYRVRIALGLLGLEYETAPVDLLTGDNADPEFLRLNPQGLLPCLVVDGQALTQSLAIIEYLHATTAGSSLLPPDPAGQYRVRQLSYAIAMEIHPICNLSVAKYATALAGGDDETKTQWMRHFIGRGLAAFEALLAQKDTGPFCADAAPTMADCCLIPQLYNARRWGVDYAAHARIVAAEAAAEALPAFRQAHPDVVGPPPG